MTLEFSHIIITAPLVSLADAKVHLRITDTDHDADVTAKLAEAQDEIVARLFDAADPAWTETTFPRPLRAALLIQLEALYDRDYNADTDKWEPRMRAVDRIISIWRDPALA
jgi:gp6-like head-tail connector protein